MRFDPMFTELEKTASYIANRRYYNTPGNTVYSEISNLANDDYIQKKHAIENLAQMQKDILDKLEGIGKTMNRIIKNQLTED